MSRMLRLFPLIFQWLSLPRGGSTQHTCDMEQLAEPPEIVPLLPLVARLEAAFAEHLPRCEANAALLRETCTRLACLVVFKPSAPPQGHRKKGRGRPKNGRANYAAGIIMKAFETITGSNIERADRNRPRGLEPLVHDVLAILEIEASAKAAIAAVERQWAMRGMMNIRSSDVIRRRH
jgi:hypothetical protein